MKNYVSPVIFDNEELAEGVYATNSGAGDCWDFHYEQDQEVNNGDDSFATFRIIGRHHTTDVKHISRSTSILINYHGNGIKGVQVDGVNAVCGGTIATGVNQYNPDEGFAVSCTTDGVAITRTYLGDAYQSGDNVNFLLRINDADGQSKCDSITWSCDHQENVQGEYD